MSVINVSQRHTTSWSDYIKSSKSDDSLIFINDHIQLSSGDGISIDLSVGDTIWQYKTNKNFKMPEDGIELKPGESIVIETLQQIALPFNILGIVVGRGSYIFRGVFLSPGKIDPGFRGSLSIGFLNSSNSVIPIKKGDLFCSCTFFQTETTLDNPPFRGKIAPIFEDFKKPWYKKLFEFFRNNPAIAISSLALIFSIPSIIWMIINIISHFKNILPTN